MGRYPAKMEDLDNTQNIRFLRKHYIDPMTGKEEWRLLHMGPNGKLIDSKIEDGRSQCRPVAPGLDHRIQVRLIPPDDGDPVNANIATRKRPSDDQIQAPMQRYHAGYYDQHRSRPTSLARRGWPDARRSSRDRTIPMPRSPRLGSMAEPCRACLPDSATSPLPQLRPMTTAAANGAIRNANRCRPVQCLR